MPRPKKTPIYEEGPQAFENFRNLAQRLVRTRPPVLVSERQETTIIETETHDVVVKKTKQRKK